MPKKIAAQATRAKGSKRATPDDEDPVAAMLEQIDLTLQQGMNEINGTLRELVDALKERGGE